MLKQHYQEPVVRIEYFYSDDIVTLSVGEGDNDGIFESFWN